MINANTLAKVSIIAGLTAASLFGLFVLRALKSREQEEIDKAKAHIASINEEIRPVRNYEPKFKDGVPPTLPKSAEVVESYVDETKGSPFDTYTEEDVTDEAMADYDPNVERFAVGDEEGQISKHSIEYQNIIHTAYGKSMNNPEYVLELVGKTFGLGARGETFETSDGLKGRRFNTEEIEKLRSKLLEDNAKSLASQDEEE